MSRPKKNRALIIVNYDFNRNKTSEKLQRRPGAEKEAKKLFRALSKCNYAVTMHYDLTAQEIEHVYKEECQADHGDYFVSILSSHGEEGVIYDCEGQPVQLTQIFQALSSERCHHNLVGKPKIFFIQACRGNEIDQGVWLETDSGSRPQTDCFSHYLTIPDDSAVMFACSPGYVSFINRWESMFLRALLEFLEGEECHFELTRLMTRINWKVAFHCQARGQYEGAKEMPCFVTNLVKEVYPFSSPMRLAPSSKTSFPIAQEGATSAIP